MARKFVGIEQSEIAGANPFTDLGLKAFFSSNARADTTFGDLDGDGDLDLITGTYGWKIQYFENTGSNIAPAFTERTGDDNPISGVKRAMIARAQLVDLDGDGDLDLVSVLQNSRLVYYENTGTASEAVFTERTGSDNPFARFAAGSDPFRFVDLDGDGDQDMVYGSSGKKQLRYFENTGTASDPAFAERTGNLNPLPSFVNEKFNSRPAFSDVDGDGDQDLIVAYSVENVGERSLYFENVGTASRPNYVARPDETTVTNNGASADASIFAALATSDGQTQTSPQFADLDGDGFDDLVVGGNSTSDLGYGLSKHRIAVKTGEGQTTVGFKLNDYIKSGGEKATMFGFDGADYMVSEHRFTSMFGGNGNDILWIKSAANSAFGGGGDDHVVNKMSAMKGSDGGIVVNGGAGRDTLDLREMSGYTSEDAQGNLKWTDGPPILTTFELYGFEIYHGSDQASYGDVDGRDDVTVGNKSLTVDYEVYGYRGNDSFNLAAGNDFADGGKGDDTLRLHGGDDHGLGGDGNDVMLGHTGKDFLDGQGGKNAAHGGDHDDIVIINKDDVLRDGAVLYFTGGSGTDTLRVAKGAALKVGDFELHGFEVFEGNDGNDTVRILNAATFTTSLRFFGGGGNDFFKTGAGNDYQDGGTGNDTMNAGAGNDEIKGKGGNDFMLGLAGDDTIDFGTGNDVGTGGADADTFVFATGYQRDRINDFTKSDGDKIDLKGVTTVSSFSDLNIAQNGANTVINFGSGDVLTLRDVTASTLDAGDFIF